MGNYICLKLDNNNNNNILFNWKLNSDSGEVKKSKLKVSHQNIRFLKSTGENNNLGEKSKRNNNNNNGVKETNFEIV